MAAAADAPARLMIKEIVLENFKSYGGKVTIGPFHERFSSVVGPNGSGKSNVIDAMLFVFGKRATTMRLKKVSELIHKSENYPDLEYAKVSVFFQDVVDLPDGVSFAVVPGSEVVVSRAVYQNQSSKYFVDDKTSSYTEVTALLKARGIDLDHNRSMVLQGEVEQIAMMKPKAAGENDSGLLEYLEDIIGSNQYVEAIDAAFKATELLNEERTSHLHRVKIVEKERAVLETAKAEAEAFLTKRYQADVKECQLEMLHKAGLVERQNGTKAQLDSLREENKDKSDQFARESAELESLAGAVAKQNKDVEKCEAALAAFKKEFDLFERKDISHREDLKHLKNKKKKAEKALEKDTAKLAELASTMTTCEADLAKAQATLAGLVDEQAREAKKLEAIYESLKGETAGLQADIEQAQEGVRPHLAVVTELQKAVDLANSERSLLLDKQTRLAAASEEANSQLAAARASVAAKTTELKALQKKRGAVDARIESSRAALQACATDEQTLTVAVRGMRAKLEESRTTRTESDSKYSVLKQLLAQAKKGKLPGLVGRLGDLGVIDDKYDVAVSTACPGLDNIVVDTTETGQACVQFLRAKNLGRATFIILSELGNLTPRMAPPPAELARLPGPRLFDLIRPNEAAYAPAFYHALRDTLVADNLDMANKIAFGSGETRYRVVTLAGELIDASGTMSGGGTRVARGLMAGTVAVASEAAAGASAGAGAELMSTQQLAELEAACNAKAAELVGVRERADALKRELDALDKEAKALETAAAKLSMDVEAASSTIAVLEARLAELASQDPLSPAELRRIDELQGEVDSRAHELARASATVKAYTDEIASLQQQILDRGGVKLQGQKAKVDMLAQRIDMTETDITKASVGIKTAQKNHTKTGEAIAKANEELAELDVQIARTVDEFKLIEQEATTVMTSCRATQAKADQMRESLAELAEQHEAKKKLVSKLKTAEVDFQGKLAELERALADGDKKIAASEAAIRELGAKVAAQRADARDVLEGADGGAGGADPLALGTEALAGLSKAALQTEIDALRAEIGAMSPNMQSIAEFREKENQYLAKVAELDDVTRRRDELRAQYDALRKKRLDEFMAGFSVITLRLKEMYQMITMGGDAELELVDSLDPFSEGIVFSVRPPKKSWKNISNLSGGEKTLSSLALVFALHHFKPTPLYVMDEIDAALDFRNVSIVANYIKERTKNAQFIIISLRNNMFELADRLVGIYKTSNSTKTVTINPNALRVPLVASAAASSSAASTQ